jgi:heat shock protein HtpX
MPGETFHTLIARNKRNSVILIGVFMLLFIGMGLLIGAVWGHGNATFSIAVAAIAGIVAFGLTMGSYYGGSSVLLSMSQAKEIVHADDPQLFNVVEEVCLAGGMPLPRIFIINDMAMNAFATGRNPQNASVAITVGLRTKLSRDELQGVMAHELSHIRNYDILYAMLMAVMIGVLVMLCDIFLRSVFWGRAGHRRGGNRNSRDGGWLQIILLVVAVVLAIIAPILARVIQMSLSRQREYLADAGSVELTRNPEGLIGALNKLGGDNEVLEVANRATAGLYFVHPVKNFEKRAASVFCTHPPIEDRVERLRQLSA